MTTKSGRLGGSRPFAMVREIQAGSMSKLVYMVAPIQLQRISQHVV